MNKTLQKTVWITRTAPNAGQSAKAFERAGYAVIAAPLLTTETLKVDAPIPSNAILIFTSQNGVRAFCESEPQRSFSVIAVGNATAALARAQGFTDVISADGTSEDIAPLIARAPNKQAHYLHISGNHVRGTVTQDLTVMGLRSERRIYYRSAPVKALPDIKFEDIDIAVFFSPLAAKTLASLMPDTGGGQTANMQAACISAATNVALGALTFSGRCIARAPTLDSLIAALAAKG